MKRSISIALASLMLVNINGVATLAENIQFNENLSSDVFKVYQGNTHLTNWSFKNREDAVKEAIRWRDSRIEHNGEVIWKFGDHMYRVYQGSTHLDHWSFRDREDAVREALKWRDSRIEHDGEVVWRFGDPVHSMSNAYVVYQGNLSLDHWSFKTREEAIREARKWRNSRVEHNGKVVWKFEDQLYRVYQGNTHLGDFIGREDAIREARRWMDAFIIQDGQRVWIFEDNVDTYRVFRSNTLVGSFTSKERAIETASKMTDSKVTLKGNTIWENSKPKSKFSVFQGSVHLGDFDSQEDAVREARKWMDSFISQDGRRVWTFEENIDTYRVFNSSSLVGSFTSKDRAIEVASKLPGSRVILKNNVVWDYEANLANSNYLVYQNSTFLGRFSTLEEAIREASKFRYSYITFKGESVWKFESATSPSTPSQSVSYTDYGITLDEMVRAQSQRLALTDAYRNSPAYVLKDHISTQNGVNGTVVVENAPVREGTSIISFEFGSLKRNTPVRIVGERDGWYQITYSNWRNAKLSDLRYYLDPSNFPLNSVGGFQFLDLSKSSNVSARDLNNNILSDKGILSNQGNAFIEAGKRHGVNEIYLVSHALLETGNGRSQLATGVLVDTVNGQKVEPRVVYNMFGIGAVDSAPLRGGSERAYNEGWFTPEQSIMGGAKFIGEKYINRSGNRQNTLYKMRWNPDQRYIWHQYATDIGWAFKQTANMKRLYDLCTDYELIYDIPKYR